MLATVIRRPLYLFLLGALAGVFFPSVYAQVQQTRPRTVTRAISVRTIPSGQKAEITGNVIRVEKGSISVCDMDSAETVVLVTAATRITTHRRGIFRGAAVHNESAFSPGLRLVVEGRGNDAGELVATRIRFHDSDFRAQTEIDTRAIPIEAEAKRLGEELEETTAVAAKARKEAMIAQESADKAQASADKALTEASTAQSTAVAAHTKIAALDDFEIAEAVTVMFNVGRTNLTVDEKTKLDEFALKTANSKGYVVEISGFADSTGGLEANHRLSQKRAETVMDYLVGVRNVPLRRIVVPYSGGEMNPVADNKTSEGRMQNRRTEVRLLVSKGLAAKEQVAKSDN
jgi:outer membrane protein OmpA-like peptidoglycan-associated protein